MRLLFLVTALAVLNIACAKNSTAKTKPKRQLESIQTPTDLRYSLVLPHSRVTHFRSLTSERRISHGSARASQLPPYAVQMEPVVQYSQKDPLYDPALENREDAVVNNNELYAQPKILHVQDQSSEGTYGQAYGHLPTAPLYSHEPHESHHPQYYEAPEPIIEIIIKESNETLPAPPTPPVQKKKKEPVHVFYVKYSKDPHNKDKVVYEKPIPAITPPTNSEEDHHEDYVTVTPEPLYVPQQTTTLRAIIKPESEVYHSDSSVKITFGNEGNHKYSDRRESTSHHSEDHEETAPRPAIAYPQQQSNHPPLERSAGPKPQPQGFPARSPTPSSQLGPQNYRPVPSQHAQNRIQFQSPHLANEQQLPRQGPSIAPFRGPSHTSRQNPFGPQPSQIPHSFPNGPPGPVQFNNNGPSIAGPIPGPGPTFPTGLPRPNNAPQFLPRPSSPPQFANRPPFNGPPRNSFHSGPQRPFHQPPQQPFFDEAKYLQENYHTITTEQVDPPKEQLLPSRPHQSFARPGPSPLPDHFQNRPQLIPINQQLPQQRPHQHFSDSIQNKPSFPSPSRPPFINLKPSPPQIDDSRPPFQPLRNQPPQQSFSFHQGPQTLSRPSPTLAPQQNNHGSFVGPLAPSPAPIPQNQFLPQPSSPTIFNYQSQPHPEQQFSFSQNFPSERPHFQQPQGPTERPQFVQSQGPSERPQFQQHNPSERPPNFQDNSNFHHQQNVAPFVPQGGELVAAIPKYEQHITVNGPTATPVYSGFNEPTPTASHPEQQYQQHQQLPQPTPQQLFENEQEQVRLQLAANVQKQQEEIQRLQAQLFFAQQQHQQQQTQQQQQRNHQQQQQRHQQEYEKQHERHQQQYEKQQERHQQQYEKQQEQQRQSNQYEQNLKQQRNNYNQQVQATSPRTYNQENSKSGQSNYVTSTSSPAYYQTTSRTVEIKPTTQKYVSSTVNSINSKPEAKKEEKKKRPTVELPDEVPDDLRQQLLSSGILDNADISILDYDKVGDTPLDSLPPDQLANFFSAGGAQQIASSENRPVVVNVNGEKVQSRIDGEDDEDQEIAASENIPSYVVAPTQQAVEMKVVHFDPKTEEGQNIAKNYVKEDATQVDPVALNDKKYNRYLPLKVSGNQFPLPDILKGRKVTSVVVLAPVETEAINGDHNRAERATSNSLKGIKFIAGDSLHDVLKRPTKDNFEKWLEIEKKTATDLQSVVLLVTGNDESDQREIFMYDIASGNVNKLSGELSSAFVDAAENNSLSKDIEKLAIEGEGTPENFEHEDKSAEASENVPLLVDLSGLSLDQDNNHVSISSGYSKTKLGRSLRRQ